MEKLLLTLITFILSSNLCFSQVTVRTVEAFGYQNCIELKNAKVKVILDPNVGGRILSYELGGKNILFENPELNGKIWKKGNPTFEVSGGRFDIGPEKTVPLRESFHNTWIAEITGKNSARLTSPIDSLLGVQLIRDFKLSDDSSHLICTQHIKNISDKVQHYAHWSRTFVKGGGISLVPLNPNSRLPKGYAMYQSNTTLLNYNPQEEENIRVREGILELIGTPSQPKFVMDSDAGWMAYNSKDNLLFVKKFKANEPKIYGDLLSNQVSVWYYKEEKCEIEPIGPLETILPGKTVSFSEDWWLMEYDYPIDKKINLNHIKSVINTFNTL